MSRRSSSTNRTDSGISRNIGTDISKVRIVAENIQAVITAAGVDLAKLAEDLGKAVDFEGITVEAGEVSSWNPETKVLVVAAVAGADGEKGDSLNVTAIAPLPNGAFSWEFSDGTVYTTPSLKGGKGDKGDTGDTGDSVAMSGIEYRGGGKFLWSFTDGTTHLTPDLRGRTGDAGPVGPPGPTGAALGITDVIHQGAGEFLWKFSDGTTYTTPSLKGAKGSKGDEGVRGEQGVSVHHIRATSTTDPEGDFTSHGETDSYTLYGDADERIVLGGFSVRNGVDGYADAVTANEAAQQAIQASEAAQASAASAESDRTQTDQAVAAIDAFVSDKERLEAAVGTSTLHRYDKALSALDVASTTYDVEGNLTGVTYTDGDGSTPYHDVMTYTDGALTRVEHFYRTPTSGTPSGVTVLGYTNGSLSSTAYTEGQNQWT